MDEERVGGLEGWKLSLEANSLLEREIGRRAIGACLAPEMRGEPLQEGSFDG